MKWLGRWLTALFLLGVVVAWAVPSGAEVPPGYEPQVKLLNPQEYQNDSGNHSGKPALVSGDLSAKQTKAGGFWGWLGDHGMGLVKGIGAGLIGAGIVVATVAVFIGAGAPFLVIAGAALIGGAIYGAIVGSARFNWTEAIIGSVIGGVSAGVGSWIAGSASPVIARAGVALTNMAGSGLASLSSYLVHESHPTWGGAAAAFGIGAGTAALFMAGGAVVSKGWVWAKGAMGFGGAGKSVPKSAVAEMALAEETVTRPPKTSVPSSGGPIKTSESPVTITSSRRLDVEPRRMEPSPKLQPRNGRVDYSSGFEDDARNFNPGQKVVDEEVIEDWVLVQYHRSDIPPGRQRSLKWWTTTEVANGLSDEDAIRQVLALPPEWGPRDAVTVARIPKGARVTYMVGEAREQVSIQTGEVFSGGGLQIRLLDFDESWVVTSRVMR